MDSNHLKYNIERVNYAVSKYALKENRMNWNEYNFLTAHLEKNNLTSFGWFAKKETKEMIEFKCCKYGEVLSKKYLEALEKDGYELNYNYRKQ